MPEKTSTHVQLRNFAQPYCFGVITRDRLGLELGLKFELCCLTNAHSSYITICNLPRVNDSQKSNKANFQGESNGIPSLRSS